MAPFMSESKWSNKIIIANQRVDGHIKLSQLSLRRIRSDGAVLCDGAGVAWRGRGRVREGVVSGVGEQ